MKTQFTLFITLCLGVMISCKQSDATLITKSGTDKNGFKYEYVQNDPSKTRIYTLDNGLKVYLSVYKK